MAYGNNRAGEQPRSHFQQAGGSSIIFKHPYLVGQLGDGITDWVDISSCVKLEGNYFNANQNQDNARQVVLIDGSVVTITNRLLNGTITMPVVKKTGLVSSGDFVAICHLIRSIGDSIGGIVIKTDYIDGKALTKVFYGVAVQSCPDDNSMGTDVAEYPVRLLYAGWAETFGVNVDSNLKKIWAVGNTYGLEAYFSPYKMQNGSTGNAPLNSDDFPDEGSVTDKTGWDDGNTGGSLHDDNGAKPTSVKLGDYSTVVSSNAKAIGTTDLSPAAATPSPNTSSSGSGEGSGGNP